MQSTDVCLPEETALFQNSRGDASVSFEFRIPWDGILNFFKSNLLFIMNETLVHVGLFLHAEGGRKITF